VVLLVVVLMMVKVIDYDEDMQVLGINAPQGNTGDSKALVRC